MTTEQQRRNRECLALPQGLSKDGDRAGKIIKAFMRSQRLTYLGGCKAFYTPGQWFVKERTRIWNAVLIVAFDGGDLARIFNLSYGCYGLNNSIMATLKKSGFWVEPLHHWCAYVYKSKL